MEQLGYDSLRKHILPSELLGCFIERTHLNPMTSKSCPKLHDKSVYKYIVVT